VQAEGCLLRKRSLLEYSWAKAECILIRISRESVQWGDSTGRTFGKETIVVVNEVTTKKPSIAKFVISFEKLDSVSLCQAQFIGTPGLEVV
jgi:hypothetical protein